MTTRRTLLQSIALIPPLAASAAKLDSDRTAWYRAAKFGMFIHWGPYSVAGVEASWPIMKPDWFPHVKPIAEKDYVALPARFNPQQYDPKSWVRLAKATGMRYMVITTKHHDGFCMFDAPGTDYKITKTPYGKDAVAMLAAACREEKMPLGFYYSPPDMHHPGFRDTTKPATANWNGEPSRPEWASYLDYMESHIKTLLTNYGDVKIIWFDGLFGQNKYNPARFHKLIHELSPRTLINDRLGPGADYVTPEQAFPEGIPVKRSEPPPEITSEMLDQFMKLREMIPKEKLEELAKDFAKKQYPTKPMPTAEEFQLWETCMTINESWGYNPSDTKFKSAEKLIQTLIEVASRGGNFLLNVGPTPLGTIPPESQERLGRIGDWMQGNSESIYQTTYGSVQNVKGFRTTAKGGTTYVHVLDWPAGGKLAIDGFTGKVKSANLLAAKKKLKFEQSDSQLRIGLPAQAPDPAATVVAVQA